MCACVFVSHTVKRERYAFLKMLSKRTNSVFVLFAIGQSSPATLAETAVETRTQARPGVGLFSRKILIMDDV